MKIRVKLIATYRDHLPPGTVGNVVEIEVPPGATVAEVAARFNIPLDDSSVIVLNGLTVPLDAPVSQGDEVAAFSAIAGGGAEDASHLPKWAIPRRKRSPFNEVFQKRQVRRTRG